MVSHFEVLAGVAGLVAGLGVAWLLWQRVGWVPVSNRRPERWHRETVRLSTEVLEAIECFEADDDPCDHDELRDRMNDMVTDLSHHAGDAVGADVDEDVVTALREASLACQELSEAHIRIGDSTEWERALERTVRAVKHAREQAADRLKDP